MQNSLSNVTELLTQGYLRVNKRDYNRGQGYGDRKFYQERPNFSAAQPTSTAWKRIFTTTINMTILIPNSI